MVARSELLFLNMASNDLSHLWYGKTGLCPDDETIQLLESGLFSIRTLPPGTRGGYEKCENGSSRKTTVAQRWAWNTLSKHRECRIRGRRLLQSRHNQILNGR